MRKFDINNPLTTDEIEKYKKEQNRNTTIFNIVFMFFGLYLFYLLKIKIQSFYLEGVFLLFICIFFIVWGVINTIRHWDVDNYFRVLDIYDYKKLLDFKKESNKINNYLNKVGKQDREIINYEFLNLKEIYKIEKKNNVKNEVFNN